MISYKQAKKYCCEDIRKIEGYNEAAADKENVWDCHHKLGFYFDRQWLIDNGLYYSQRAEMLVFIPTNEHKNLHKKPISEETKRKISEKLMGHPVSLETRRKMSESDKGRTGYWEGKHRSEETIRKVSEKNRGRSPWNKGKSGEYHTKPHTDEVKKKISESQPTRKTVYQYTPDGTHIATYSSLVECGKQTGFHISDISSVCNGRRKYSHGFIWSYTPL